MLNVAQQDFALLDLVLLGPNQSLIYPKIIFCDANIYFVLFYVGSMQLDFIFYRNTNLKGLGNSNFQTCLKTGDFLKLD